MNAVQRLLTDHLDIWTAADTAKKSGRGRSSGNAASVYGIRKLRELIFELAALGRLIDEDIHQPAKLVQLGEIAEFVMGQAPPGSECNTNGIGTIFVKTGEFGSLYPEECEWTTKPLKFAKKGDVLICVVGATVGKLNLAIDCAIGRSVAAIRPVTGLDTKYIYFALMPFTLRLRAQSRGSAQGVIGKAELNAVQIRLPSIAEQHRIVAKVDELLALCDQLETRHTNAAEAHEKLVSQLLGTLTLSQSAADFSANWQRIAAHFDTLFTTEASIDALKQTLLQLAVMGKLVPQDPHDEPASELLKRIQAEKTRLIAEGKIRKDKLLAAITEEEKLIELPTGWQWVRLDTIAEIRGGKRVSNGYQLLTQPTPYIYIRVSDMKEGSIDDSDLHYIDSEMREKISRYIITKDDIYMTIVGATIGKCGIVPEKFDQMNLTENAARLTPCEGIEKLFLYKCLDSSICQSQFFDKTKQVGVQKMALNRLASTIIFLPPRAEQIRILAKLDELMALCDQLKSRIAAASQLQQKLAEVMVEQAVA